MNGAAGATEEAMRNTLVWGTLTRAEINAAYRDLATLLPTLDPAVTFKGVNAIWTREPLRANADFVSDASQYFKAAVNSAATPQAMFDAVNAWGNQATEGLVPKVLQDPPPDNLTMLLANALLFKGQWRERFDASKTAPAPFRLEGGASVSVPMMTRTGGFRASGDSGVTVVELAYGNTAYSMLIFVPRTAPIGDFATSLDATRVAHLIGTLSPQDRSPLFMPKFRVTGSRELRPTLEAMGMGVAFSDQASFPRLFSDASGQRLAFVRHAVTVDVDEEGTKAAAVTVVGVVPVSLPASFNVNRPFLFFIRERFTGALLFTGIVRDPRQ
jgi:serpin B